MLHRSAMGSFVAEEVHAVHFHTSVCGSVSPVSSPRALMQLISEPVNIFCFKLGCLFLCLEKKSSWQMWFFFGHVLAFLAWEVVVLYCFFLHINKPCRVLQTTCSTCQWSNLCLWYASKCYVYGNVKVKPIHMVFRWYFLQCPKDIKWNM